jgi:hypothetical protein
MLSLDLVATAVIGVMGYGAFLLLFRRERRILGLGLLLVSVWVFGSASIDWRNSPDSGPARVATERPAPAPATSREPQKTPTERKYLKVTSVTFSDGYATVIVQGTSRDVPIQCVVQHKLSKDYIATEDWYITTDLVTEVIIGMPDVFSTASLAVICFEID